MRVRSGTMPTLSLDGWALWYSDQGRGNAVLVIRGAGSDGRMWAKDLVPLEGTRRVLAFNRRGYPGSGPSSGRFF